MVIPERESAEMLFHKMTIPEGNLRGTNFRVILRERKEGCGETPLRPSRTTAEPSAEHKPDPSVSSRLPHCVIRHTFRFG